MEEKHYTVRGLEALFTQRHPDKVQQGYHRGNYYYAQRTWSSLSHTLLKEFICAYASAVPRNYSTPDPATVYALDGEAYVDAMAAIVPPLVEDGAFTPEYRELIDKVNREQGIVLINGILKELLPLVYVGKRSNMTDPGLLKLKAFLENLPKNRLIRTPKEVLALKSELGMQWGRHVPPTYVDDLLTALLLVAGITPKTEGHYYVFGGRDRHILNHIRDAIELAYKSTSSDRLHQQMNAVLKKIGDELVNVALKYKGATTDRVLSDFCQTVGMGMPIYFKKARDEGRSERIAKILEGLADKLCKEYGVTRGDRRPADAVLDIINARPDDFEAILNKVLDAIDKCAKGGSYIVPAL